MDVKQLLKTTIGKIRMLFAEEEIFYIGGSDVLPPPLEKEQELSGSSFGPDNKKERLFEGRCKKNADRA